MTNGRYRVQITMLVEVEAWEEVVQAARNRGLFAGSEKRARFFDYTVADDSALATASALQDLVSPPPLDVPGAKQPSGPGWSAQVSVKPDSD